MAVDGLLKAGDSASTVNPISRAGIVEAMKCGTLAGEYALRMLPVPEKKLAAISKAYEKAWFEKLGRAHHRLSKVKSALARIPDSDFNRGAKAIASIPQAERTMSRIFALSVGRSPRLVWALRHLM